MVRHGVRRQHLAIDAPTRWATLLIGAGAVASTVAIVAVWPLNQPPLDPLPGPAAVVAPPSAPSTVTVGPAASLGSRVSPPSPSPAPTRVDAGTTPDPGLSAVPSPSPPSASPVQEPEATLVVEHSGKCADVWAAVTTDGADVVQSECHGQAHQRFRLVDAGHGYVTIRASHSGKCLGVRNGSFRDHARIVQVTCSGRASQQFWPQDIGRDRVRLVIRHSGKCVDVADESLQDGARLIQWPCHRNANQRWRVIAA